MKSLNRILLGTAVGVTTVMMAGMAAQAHAPLPGQHGVTPASHYKLPPVLPGSGRWRKVYHAFPGKSPDTALLLTDGTLMVHDACTTQWYEMRPALFGGYGAGENLWDPLPAMPSGYAPLYFASQVLKDGRVIVNGGEYNAASEGNCGSSVWTNKGALYDTVAHTWTAVSPPAGWTQIGDAASAVLDDGTYMLADCCDSGPNAALASISGTTVTWTATGTGKADSYDEEGWTNLPGGRLLTVDAFLDTTTTHSRSELYIPSTGAWRFAGYTHGRMEDPQSSRLGPAVLRPDGTVFQVGANDSGTTNTRSKTTIYNIATGKWSAGPVLPAPGGVFLSAEGAPAALLPSGNVLVQLSPAYTCLKDGSPTAYCAPSHFYEFDGSHFIPVAAPASASSIAAYESRMLELPTGQVLWTSDMGDVEIYTPQGTPNDAWRPTITQAPDTLTCGSANNLIQGTLFHGLSLGASYGNNAQMSTNYPLVRITNLANGWVFYARTHDHSRMGISTGTVESTYFDTIRTGLCPGSGGSHVIEVVVNGIASAQRPITLN